MSSKLLTRLCVLALSTVMTPFLALATTYLWKGGAAGDIADPANWDPTPNSQFTSSDELVITMPTRLLLLTDITVGKITVNSLQGVIFSLKPNVDNAKLNVGSIENNGKGVVQFGCPVQFLDTLKVYQNIGAVTFPGGAEAKYPDPSMRTTSSSVVARTLNGNFNFTQDWTVSRLNGSYPWFIASGSRVEGKAFIGAESSTHRILEIPYGAYARFTKVHIGEGKGEIALAGYLEATEDCALSASAILGRGSRTGVLKAYKIRKSSGNIFYSNVAHMYVGAGGYGPDLGTYDLRLNCNTTITATDNFAFLGEIRYENDRPVTTDWGINLQDKRLTIDVPEGLTVTIGINIYGSGIIRKVGKGTLVMTDTNAKGVTGFAKSYSDGTEVDEGTLRIVASNQVGTGPIMVAGAGRVEIASGVKVDNFIMGEGTVYLENGAEIEVNPAYPACIGKVEIAPGATAKVSAKSTPAAPAMLITGVAESDYSRISLPSDFQFFGGAAVIKSSAAAGDYVWAGENGTDWNNVNAWRVNGQVPAMVPGEGATIRFENATPITVGGAGALRVTKIVTTSGAPVTFGCPVQFAGTYYVENLATPPVFAAGATATFPDNALANKTLPSHILPDKLTFTGDWVVPALPQFSPFVVPEGATIKGKSITAAAYHNKNISLRIDEGANAEFDSAEFGHKFVFRLNGGNIVVNGDFTFGKREGDPVGNDFGQFQGNEGSVIAKGLYKSVSGGHTFSSFITDFVIGANGFGMLNKDYNLGLNYNTRLTATADMRIHEPTGGNHDSDWGIELYNSAEFTVDTGDHLVEFNSLIRDSSGVLVKEGSGELVMQSRPKKHTGGTFVKAGKLTLNTSDRAGYGPITIENGATLSLTENVSVNSYPITIKSGGTLEWKNTVNMTALLKLESGATLRPLSLKCFDAAGGGIELPADGKVNLDLTALQLNENVSFPILGGVANGMLDIFNVIIPEDISAEVVSGSGILKIVSGNLPTLTWNPIGESIWSTSVAAWLNKQGAQTAFIDNSNVIIPSGASIEIPADVKATDITINTDSNVSFAGEGKILGYGNFVKNGEGTLDFNAKGGLEGQTLYVSNGVFKVGDDLKNHALGGTSDSTPIVVAKGATLDVNYYTAEGVMTEAERVRLIHDKLVRIAGDGVDGRGAVVSDRQATHNMFTGLVLDDDASIGGTQRMDIRAGSSSSTYARTQTYIYGPNKRLTVKGYFGIIDTDITLGALRVDPGATLQFQYEGVINIQNGIELNGGTLYFEYGSNIGNTPVKAIAGDNIIRAAVGDGRIGAPITVASGATLTQTGGNIYYNSSVNGLAVTGGNAYYNWGGGKTIRYIQDSGTIDYRGGGFSHTGGSETTDHGNSPILFMGGAFNAANDWSINHFIPTYFMNDWTLNQKDGTTATWHTPLYGDGNVTLNGKATLVGDKEMKGALGGKWTVGEGFTAGLEGAASFLGGLEIKDGGKATINIAEGRSAVFTGRDFGNRDLSNADSLAGRFNKEMNASTRGTITHDETILFSSYSSGNRPFGDTNQTATFASGQFYVASDMVGTWEFVGKCDDRVALWIDGNQVLMAAGDCQEAKGSYALTEGWHSFRHIISDNSGGFGADYNAKYTLSYKFGDMTDFKQFSVKNLKMRPATDFGDPNNANTIRWSHYKGDSSTVNVDNYKRDDFAWDFCCITNNLDMVQWKGNSSTYMNGYTVNRYEGWFFVTKENADKEWTFKSQYDDRGALWIDGIDSGLTGENENSPEWKITLSYGWHKFKLQTFDISGGAGPWNTGKFAYSYRVGDGEERQFHNDTLKFSVCPDGYIQGGITLASGAVLENGASGSAVVYDGVTATGAGARISGGFKFDGGALRFLNVPKNANNLSSILEFEAPVENYLIDINKIEIDFTDNPTRSKVKICPAGGLTAQTAIDKLVVTQKGEPINRVRCEIDNEGDLVAVLSVPVRVIVR